MLQTRYSLFWVNTNGKLTRQVSISNCFDLQDNCAIRQMIRKTSIIECDNHAPKALNRDIATDYQRAQGIVRELWVDHSHGGPMTLGAAAVDQGGGGSNRIAFSVCE